jgi:hypothetical protein
MFPNTAPPNKHANTIRLIVMELMLRRSKLADDKAKRSGVNRLRR